MANFIYNSDLSINEERQKKVLEHIDEKILQKEEDLKLLNEKRDFIQNAHKNINDKVIDDADIDNLEEEQSRYRSNRMKRISQNSSKLSKDVSSLLGSQVSRPKQHSFK